MLAGGFLTHRPASTTQSWDTCEPKGGHSGNSPEGRQAELAPKVDQVVGQVAGPMANPVKNHGGEQTDCLLTYLDRPRLVSAPRGNM